MRTLLSPRSLTDAPAWQAWAAETVRSGVTPPAPPYAPDWARTSTTRLDEVGGCTVVFWGRPHKFGHVTLHVVCEIHAREDLFNGPVLTVAAPADDIETSALIKGSFVFDDPVRYGVGLGRALIGASHEAEDIQRRGSRQLIASPADEAVTLELLAMVGERGLSAAEVADQLGMTRAVYMSRVGGHSHWRVDEFTRIALTFGTDPDHVREILARLTGILTAAVWQ